MGFRICFDVKFDLDKGGLTRICFDLPVLIIRGWKLPPPLERPRPDPVRPRPDPFKPRPEPWKLLDKLSLKTKDEIATLVALDETAKGLSPSGRKKFQAVINPQVIEFQKKLPVGVSIEYKINS